MPPVDAAAPAVSGFVVGVTNACVLQPNGGVGCFSFPMDAPPASPLDVQLAPVPGIAGATQIAGHDPFCARLADGSASCWATEPTASPAIPVAGLDHVVRIDTADISCAVRDDGSVWCWGSNMYNALGLGNICPDTNPDCDDSVHPPGPVVSLGAAIDVAVSPVHVCARTSGGDVFCWGRVGIGDTVDYPVDRSVPVVVPAAHGARSLAVSEGETIATLDAALVVFGHPMSAEAPDAPTPTTQPRASGEQVFGGAYDTFCRKLSGASVHCTGGIALGGGEPGGFDYDVPGTESATAVAMGPFTACALLSRADFMCWGMYFDGPTRVHAQ